MKLGGIDIVPDPRDVAWLIDPANLTIIIGMPPTVYCTTTATHQGDISHPPLGHDAGLGAIRHTLPSWGVSTALGPDMFQRWGARISAGAHRGPGGNVYGTRCAPRRLTN